MTLARDIIIASACEAAHNKYASGYLNAVHARLVAAVIENQPPSFGLHTPPDVYLHDAPEYLQAILRAVDDVIHAVAVEADDCASTAIVPETLTSLCGSALHDSSMVEDLQDAGEQLREDLHVEAMERA
jgi:hypothetical protein